MKFSIKYIGVLVILFVITGCSLTTPEVPTKANTLIDDLSLLKPSPNDEHTLYYVNKDTDFTKYNDIIINSLKIITDNKESHIDQKLISDVYLYFDKKLQDELKPIYKNNGKDKKSLQLSISIISMEASYDDLKIYQYLPYGLAFTALKRGSGYEKKKLKTSLALKLYDAKTLKTLVLLLDLEKSSKEIKDIENISLNDIKPILDSWAQRYKLRLTELKNGKYKKLLKDR